MKRQLLILIILCLSATLISKAQLNSNYSISIKPHAIDGFKGLQSYAGAQYNGKLILIGGRKEGLHRRQPFAAFDPQFNNTEILFIDPINNNVYSKSTDSLPTVLKEQLQATNMQFLQNGKILYIIGGYGYSATIDAHTTYAKMIVVDLEQLSAAVLGNTSLESCFKQIQDTLFAVAGGQLGLINETFYLAGGQKFEGSYNPNGPDFGPGFYQQYSNQIRKFKIDENKLTVTDITILTDTINLHRRDYNMLPQIFNNNENGFTLFSGVFKYNVNVPYTNTVDVFATQYKVNNDFMQYFNHYNCPKVVLYDEKNKRNDNLFFGGIAQFYFGGKNLVEDNDVPFTKAITCVSRDSNGVLTEGVITELKSYLNTGAEFFVNPKLEMFSNQIIKLNSINEDSILLGYIVGGISSKNKNIFWENTGVETTITNYLQDVWIKKTKTTPSKKSVPPNSCISQLQVYSDADFKNFILSYWLKKPCSFTFNLYDKNYKLLKSKNYSNSTSGYQTELFPFPVKTATYYFSIKTGTETINRKLIIDLE